jgi:hypothetical protein
MVRVKVQEKGKEPLRFGIQEQPDGSWAVIDRAHGGELVEGTTRPWKIAVVGIAGRLNKAAREGRLIEDAA